jgi:hypothetical protein
MFELTDEARAIIESTREELWSAATSTATDRPAAEAAVAVIVQPALVTYEIHWVSCPAEGASLRASLSDSLWASFRDSLSDSLSDSLWASLSDSLWASLSDSLRDSLRDSLWASLRDSLSDSLWASLRASLSDSLWASLRASGWVAYWVAAVRITGHAGADVDRLEAYVALAQSAFAVWVMPGHVILCAKPTAAVVTDGRLVAVEWPTR